MTNSAPPAPIEQDGIRYVFYTNAAKERAHEGPEGVIVKSPTGQKEFTFKGAILGPASQEWANGGVGVYAPEHQ